MNVSTLAFRCICLSIATIVLSASSAIAELKKTRPNIIVVMTDDQGKGDLSCLGNKILRTPHVDRLYTQSLRFRDFHVSPTCAPTRSAIMTGRHEFKNGVTHTILERERMTLDAVTLAESLHDAGYATGIFGKWHLGDEEAYQPHNRGFTNAFIHGAGGMGQAYSCSCADAPPNRENRYFDPVISHNGKFVQTEGFCTDIFFQAALGWIKQQQEMSQPFFVFLTPNAPHGPMIAPKKNIDRFLKLGYDSGSAGRMGMIENIDENMGLLMEKLAQWKLEENTLLIFMTDNGQAGRSGKRNGKRVQLDSSGFKSGKGSVYEGGTSVPAFWRWKDVLPAGKDCDALTAHIDMFPTFAELTGASIPENQVRGRSMLPLLENSSASWQDRFLFAHKGRWAKGTSPQPHKHKAAAVRTSRFRLVDNKELYDILADPFEKENVIGKHPQQVAKMRAAYNTWWNETVPMMVNEDVPNSATKPFWLRYEKQKQSEGIPKWSAPKL